jgi:hypothetical protein
MQEKDITEVANRIVNAKSFLITFHVQPTEKQESLGWQIKKVEI